MKKLNTLFIVGIVVFSFISCDTNKPEKKAGHVILIGLDGWTARSIEKADMPNVKQLMQEGSYTLKKTFGTSIVKCNKLGYHVYGLRT